MSVRWLAEYDRVGRNLGQPASMSQMFNPPYFL
jgi:hypothetical protein